MSEQTYVNEVDAITQLVQCYVEGARHGQGATMKQTCHNAPTIYGDVGKELFGGPIQGLYDWGDGDGPAKDIQARLSSIEVVGNCANVRVDADNWSGHRFTDFLNLVKFDGQWKIASVFR